MHTHKSHSERALCSQVLRIRLSRQIAFPNALFSRFKSLIWKSFAFTKGNIRKGSESWSKTAFGTWLAPLWTGQKSKTHPHGLISYSCGMSCFCACASPAPQNQTHVCGLCCSRPLPARSHASWLTVWGQRIELWRWRGLEWCPPCSSGWLPSPQRPSSGCCVSRWQSLSEVGRPHLWKFHPRISKNL